MAKHDEKIVVAEDNPRLQELITKRLEKEGYEVYKADNGRQALELINKIIPDLIILDIKMPELDGYEVKRALSKQKLTETIPVIFLTGRDELSDKVKGLSLGADDYITKPFKKEELLARIEAILRRKRYYENMAMHDTLTGVYNVTYFNQQFSQFFNMAERYGHSFSILFIDVNKFKYINDTYGHKTGDTVLQSIAEIMEQKLRKSDIISRYGGDEFAIILPHTELEKAEELATRLKEAVASTKIKNDESAPIAVSISIGCAAYSSGYKTKDNMFEVADKKMYESKRSSGN
ncbi:MAG: diguanylate cyclase [Spirochaetales bacterium]|nr:diguanylate cyclase [Spirochaetales bacterium]